MNAICFNIALTLFLTVSFGSPNYNLKLLIHIQHTKSLVLLTLVTRYGTKLDASVSCSTYFWAIRILNMCCKYSRPLKSTDGLVSKNLNVIHLRIKSRLLINPALLSSAVFKS